MAEIRTDVFENELVLYFDSESSHINAYTLASVLVGFADAIKRANAATNPGYEIEVVVEAVGSGSFKTVIRTVYNEVKNLFSVESLRAIVLAIVATFIYEHFLSPNQPIDVKVDTQEVVVSRGNDRIIVPRSLHDATEQVARSDKFKGSVSEVFRALELDHDISGFGLTPDFNRQPDLVVPRSAFPDMVAEPASNENERHVLEVAQLTIVRAILERSNRKWQFIWGGVRISAPIEDKSFYDSFDAHRITIAPGDSLVCEVEILQKRDTVSGVFANTAYRVVRVLDHVPRESNPDLSP